MEAEYPAMQMTSAQMASEHRAQSDSVGTLPMEWLAYASLALLALVLRVAALDAVPLSEAEAEMSLHAWHTVEDDAPGIAAIASSPLSYNLQILTFSTLGASEFSARIGSALAGIALSFSPLLFRGDFGQTRTFIWCALLSVLTVPVASARAGDGTTFLLLFAVLAVWMIRRYWYSHKLRDAMMAIVFVSFMTLLSSPAGIPLLLILAISGWLAVWRTALSAPQRLDLPGDDILQLAVKRLRAFPFGNIILLPILVTLLAGTMFMLNPAGLRTVGQLLSSAGNGFSQSASPDGLQLGFIALASYEPLLIIFAVGGAWLLWKKGDVTYIDRFAAAWAVVGALGLLLYKGATPADAMWLIVPLTLLASYGITQLMVDRRVVVLWASGSDDDVANETELYSTRYWWVKWVLSAGVLFFLIILSVQLAQVARLMLNLPPGTGFAELFALLMESAHVRLLQGIGLLTITAIISLIVFLLVANFWGLGTTLQGLGLGFLWLMLASGIGGAWQASVAAAGAPDGLWRQGAVTDEAELLRTTLFELADRETSGFPLLELTIVKDSGDILSEGGLIAWLTRDFPNARFVNAAEEAAGAQIVLLAEGADGEALAGNYVGQRFVLQRSWSLNQAGIWDLAAWWTQRRVRDASFQTEAVMLWLRQDVYDGIPIEERAQ